MWRRRWALGIERLAFQGIFVPVEVANKYSGNPSLLSDLAGNAFCMVDFLAVLVSMLGAVGQSESFLSLGGVEPKAGAFVTGSDSTVSFDSQAYDSQSS